jgi:hypothetical protein
MLFRNACLMNRHVLLATRNRRSEIALPLRPRIQEKSGFRHPLQRSVYGGLRFLK